MTAFQVLQQELHQITLELGQAYIANAPKGDLADDARTIQSFLALAERRPAIRSALGVTIDELNPAWNRTRDNAPPPQPMMLPLVTVSNTAPPAEVVAELAPLLSAARVEVAKDKKQRSNAEYHAEYQVRKEARIASMAALALDPASPDLTVKPDGEIPARRAERLGALRAWAQGAGLQVKKLGPLPPSTYDAYRLARQLASKSKLAKSLQGQVAVLGAPVKTETLPDTTHHCRRADKVKHLSPTEARVSMEQFISANPRQPELDLLSVYACAEHYHWGRARNEHDRARAIAPAEEAAHNIAAQRRRHRHGLVHITTASVTA